MLIGTPFQGVWSVPKGGSYVGQLISDAGGIFPLADDQDTGSAKLDFEAVYARSGQAPVWIAHTPLWKTVGDVVAADPRYGKLAAVQEGQVWTNTRAIGPTGGIEFYEQGVLQPDVVLADLLAILHPELLPGHEFTYYHRLPE